MSELKLTLDQRLQQKLSPQQIQTMKLLELPALQLEQRIRQEIEENPLLEEADEGDKSNKQLSIEEFTRAEETPYYKVIANNRSKDEPLRQVNVPSSGMSLQEHLLEQLNYCDLTPQMEIITRYLVGNIDDDGYLRNEEQTIVDDIAFTYGEEVDMRQVEIGIDIIQGLDPAGVGARDLKECLLLQLDTLPNNSYERMLARRILTSYFEDFSKRRFDRLLNILRITENQLRGAVEEIRRLSPKPGNLYMGNTEDSSPYVSPDFMIDYHEGEFTLRLNRRGVPDLKISSEYADHVTQLSQSAGMGQKEKSDAQRFVRKKMESAKYFIGALKQRNETMMHTMKAIVEYQRKYFIDGNESSLRPMILRDIAELTGMDVSTISRVVNGKYMQTHFGVLPLRSIFTESISTDEGTEVSAKEVRKILTESIETENKRYPLTDDELTTLLNEAGYKIARRTVAKYREALGIPVARLRREV